MIAVLMMLLTAPEAPAHDNLVGVFRANDYPPTALAHHEQGAAYVQLVIDPQGRLDSCTILLSSGYEDLDNVSCEKIMSRAKFAPANRDTPIYRTYRQSVTWRMSTSWTAPATPPDVDLTINQAPEGVEMPVELTVEYLVKADGTASRCQLASYSKPAPKVLIDLACSAVTQSPLQIVRDHNKLPVDALDSAKVRFSVKP